MNIKYSHFVTSQVYPRANWQFTLLYRVIFVNVQCQKRPFLAAHLSTHFINLVFSSNTSNLFPLKHLWSLEMEDSHGGNLLNPSSLHQLSPGENSRNALLSISDTLESSEVVFLRKEAEEELLRQLESNMNRIMEVNM